MSKAYHEYFRASIHKCIKFHMAIKDHCHLRNKYLWFVGGGKCGYLHFISENFEGISKKRRCLMKNFKWRFASVIIFGSISTRHTIKRLMWGAALNLLGAWLDAVDESFIRAVICAHVAVQIMAGSRVVWRRRSVAESGTLAIGILVHLLAHGLTRNTSL